MLKVGQKLHFGLKVCNVNDNNIIKTTREKNKKNREENDLTKINWKLWIRMILHNTGMK